MPKIAYLFGAGASAGEMSQKGAPEPIHMTAIVDGIVDRMSSDRRELPDNVGKNLSQNVANLLMDDVNIEQLITLYERSGTTEHVETALELKRLFRVELEKRVRNADVNHEPALFAALLDMHSLTQLDEQLILVLTTNYEDLIEQAMQDVLGGVNYVIKTAPTNGTYDLKDELVPFLKLHGSFNWKNESPIMIQNDIENEGEPVWIPPGVAKNRENYPFDLIWGKARELLDCDVLRIIGSSLSMNDWELVSLVHATQNFRTDQQPAYAIEIIDYPSRCKVFKDQHKYLNIKTVLEIPEFSTYLIRSYLPARIGTDVSEEELMRIGEQYLGDSENIFAHWLRAKGEALSNIGVQLETEKGYFKEFVIAGL